MRKIIFILALFFLSTHQAWAQWPGYFYSFTLKDASDHPIDPTNTEYKVSPAKPDDKTHLLLELHPCLEKGLWRYAVEGEAGLDDTHSLTIEKAGPPKETMMIEFPSSLSQGEKKYFMNLYAGTIKFVDGTYQVKLPNKPSDWDKLKRAEVCPDPKKSYDYNFRDLSPFQK